MGELFWEKLINYSFVGLEMVILGYLQIVIVYMFNKDQVVILKVFFRLIVLSLCMQIFRSFLGRVSEYGCI